MKRKDFLFLSVCLAFFWMATPDVRADLLRVRLARTAPQGEVTPELQEIAEILVRNLNLQSCVLLDEKMVPFSNIRQTFKLRGYWIDLLPQSEETVLVTVFRRQNRILQSSVRISTEAPLILGGFRPMGGQKRNPRKPPMKEGKNSKEGHGGPPPRATASDAPSPARFEPGVRHILILERLPEATAEDEP